MIRRARRDGREARKGRIQRIKKGSREGIEKETKRQFEEKEGLRDPLLLEFLDPTPSCSHCFFKSSGCEHERTLAESIQINSLLGQLVQSGGTRDRGVNIVSVPTKSGLFSLYLYPLSAPFLNPLSAPFLNPLSSPSSLLSLLINSLSS